MSQKDEKRNSPDTVRSRTEMAHKIFPRGILVFFATENTHKFNEARRVLEDGHIVTAMLRMHTSEIQSDNIEDIARGAALDAARRSRLPVIVEDAGLFIDALSGFPGPYSKYIYRTIGNEGVLKLLEDGKNRRARFRSVVAFCSYSDVLRCFHGVVEGRIAERPRGTSGFGFDPIFEPTEGKMRTFGEMTGEEKNMLSHRACALREFARWYRSNS